LHNSCTWVFFWVLVVRLCDFDQRNFSWCYLPTYLPKIIYLPAYFTSCHMENLIGYQNSCNFNCKFMLYTPYLYDLVKGPLYLLHTKFTHNLNCKANCKTPIFSHSLVKPHGTYDRLGRMVLRLGYAMWHIS
jgi:hypothetical protein